MAAVDASCKLTVEIIVASFQALMGFVGTNKQALKEAAGSTASGRRGFQEGRSHFSSHLFVAFATCMPNLVHSGRSLLTSLVFHAPGVPTLHRGVGFLARCHAEGQGKTQGLAEPKRLSTRNSRRPSGRGTRASGTCASATHVKWRSRCCRCPDPAFFCSHSPRRKQRPRSQTSRHRCHHATLSR